MNTWIRRVLRSVSLGVFCAAISLSSMCQTVSAATSGDTEICTPTGIIIGYFNGVNTSEATAILARDKLALQYGTTAPVSGETMQYEYFYNHTDSLPTDILETLDLRLKEIDSRIGSRWDYMYKFAHGDLSWIDKIKEISSDLGQQIADTVSAQESPFLNALAISISSHNSSTSADLSDHQQKLTKYITEGKKFVFVAHSEGNLFANRAYHFVTSGISTSSGTRIGIARNVHLAPASTEVNGPYVLGDLDLVINGLRVSSGSVMSPNWPMLGFLLRKPDTVLGKTDWMGHGFFEIYNNSNDSGVNETGRAKLNAAFDSALNTVDTTPRPNGQQLTDGFFTITLRWANPGDIDLHVLEPDGTHVYYANKQGHSGKLDVDDTTGTGPEHYYATCSASALQIGLYTVGVLNFANASSTTASITVYDSNQQPVGPAEGWVISLGGPTSSSNMPGTLFQLNVSKDSNGNWTVAPGSVP